MPLDYDSLEKAEAVEGVQKAMRSIAEAAYEQGARDALVNADRLDAMLAKMTAAMQGFDPNMLELIKQHVIPKDRPDRASIQPRLVEHHTGNTHSRARRGLVGETVAEALRMSPGQNIGFYEQLVTELSPEISVKSVGNELRRGERDGRYKRDRLGGYLWYLVEPDETEAEGQSSGQPSASYSNQGGDDD